MRHLLSTHFKTLDASLRKKVCSMSISLQANATSVEPINWQRKEVESSNYQGTSEVPSLDHLGDPPFDHCFPCSAAGMYPSSPQKDLTRSTSSWDALQRGSQSGCRCPSLLSSKAVNVYFPNHFLKTSDKKKCNKKSQFFCVFKTTSTLHARNGWPRQRSAVSRCASFLDCCHAPAT